MMLLALDGEMPAPGKVRVVDGVLVAIMDHGITPSSLVTRLVLDGAPESMSGAVSAGLLAVGSRFLGTIEESGALLARIVAEAGNGDTTAAARDALTDLVASGQRVPGFGHNLHGGGDPRVVPLLELTKSEGLAGLHIAAFEALPPVVEQVLGKALVPNVAGCDRSDPRRPRLRPRRSARVLARRPLRRALRPCRAGAPGAARPRGVGVLAPRVARAERSAARGDEHERARQREPVALAVGREARLELGGERVLLVRVREPRRPSGSGRSRSTSSSQYAAALGRGAAPLDPDRDDVDEPGRTVRRRCLLRVAEPAERPRERRPLRRRARLRSPRAGSRTTGSRPARPRARSRAGRRARAPAAARPASPPGRPPPSARAG